MTNVLEIEAFFTKKLQISYFELVIVQNIGISEQRYLEN